LPRLTRALPASAAMLLDAAIALRRFQLLFAFTPKDIAFSYYAYAIMMPFFDAILIFRQMLLRHAFRCQTPLPPTLPPAASAIDYFSSAFR
jgi:hypothetical protein